MKSLEISIRMSKPRSTQKIESNKMIYKIKPFKEKVKKQMLSNRKLESKQGSKVSTYQKESKNCQNITR